MDSLGETFTNEEWSSLAAATAMSDQSRKLAVTSITPRLPSFSASDGDSDETENPGRADDTPADPWDADIARLGLRGGDRRLNKVTTIGGILRSNNAAFPAAAHAPAKPAGLAGPEACGERGAGAGSSSSSGG